jgi:hypothetical protein
MNKKQKWLLRLSVLANIIFVIIFLLNYTAYSYKLCVLKKDVKLGVFNNKDSVYFTLPKGLTVRDVSERGLSAIDLFENNRFEIIITSEDDSLVDYNEPKGKLLPFGNLYSADSNKNK